MALKKREEKAPEGAPAWLVTYGDMVTLLLTFFVLLLAMSEVKKEDKFMEFMQALREAFGYQGGVRPVPIEQIQMPKNVIFSEKLILPVDPHDFSKTRDPGLRGKRRTVRDNRLEEVFVVGGRIYFPELSADLSAEEAAQIPQLVEAVRGYSTILRVTGHCSLKPTTGSGFRDHMDLAFERARAVAQVLIEQGIDPRRIKIESAGTLQPVATRAYTEAERLRNDFVEILQINERAGQ